MPKIADFFAELGLKKDKFDKGMDEAGRAPSKLGGAFSALGGTIAAAFSVGAIVAFGDAALKAWDAQEKANAGLLQALKGRKDLQEALLQQASDLQRTTLFEDDAIVQAQKMLAVMGLSVSQIKDLIPLIADFSTATGMDLAQAANLAGKAIGTGTNALGRYGVELDSTMSKTEKANEIMAVFTERYGNQAEKAAKAGASGLQQLNKAWGEIKETIGSKIGPFIAAMAQLLAGKGFEATTGTAATGIQKTINDYINADQAGRDRIQKGLEMSLAEYNRLWKEAKDKDDAVNRSHYAGQADIAREALEKIADINKTATAQKTAEEQAAIEEAKKKAAEQVEIAKDMARKLEFIQQDLIDASSNVGDNLFTFDPDKIDMSMFEDMDIEPIPIPVDIETFNKGMLEAKMKTEEFVREMGAIFSDFMANFVSTFAQGIGDLITGDQTLEGFFKSILNSIGEFVKQMGEAMIAYGVGVIAFEQAFSNPYAAIAAGAALVAIGAVISNLASKGPDTSGMAGSGGGGYSNPGYQSGVIGANGQMILTTEVSGDNLLLILQRAENNRLRTRG